VGSAGAIGPVLVARGFDVTGSYEGGFLLLAAATAAAALLALTLPDYRRGSTKLAKRADAGTTRG
jgi:hypothetical protein